MPPMRLARCLLACALLPLSAQAPCPPSALQGPPAQHLLNTFETWLGYLERWVGPEIPDWVVHSTVVTYAARRPLFDDGGRPVPGPDGQQACGQIAQSARIFFPPVWRAPAGRRLPLVVYTHATSLQKQAVASAYGGHEWLMGAAAAAYYGFAVAMPDQPGMGLDAEHYHPFCHAQSLAYATIDGLPAMEQVFQKDAFLQDAHYAWDGRLFLMGYSEGAYTALATVKELETHRDAYAAKGIGPVTGAACMAGPFDLSGLTRADMINPLRRYAHCFYLPFVLRGYHEVYGAAVDPEEALAPVLLEEREDGNILRWIDGTRSGLSVDELVGRRLGVPDTQVVFRDMLNPAWLARELDDPSYETSTTHRLLVENDLHRGWAPTSPILFAQSPVDQDLPYQNTVATMGYLSAEIVKAGGDPRQLLTSVPLGDCRDGVTHLEGALLAIPLAFKWIYDGMPMD